MEPVYSLASVAGILLDIEGTTSSVSFVFDVMFPFVRRELSAYLTAHGNDVDLAPIKDQIARDAGQTSWEAWRPQTGDEQAFLERHLLDLMDRDVKATGLKALQGRIWEAGFASGELQAHVYPDVVPALRRWQERGVDVRIYSSGSVQAQRLFFGHTIVGNLLPIFRGHYDTTIGSKREALSYEKIAAEYGRPAAELLFASDVVPELDAARAAGWQTVLVLRPGNASPPADHSHPAIHSFDEIL